MLKQKVEKIINDQIQKEAYSSFLYLSMACWADNQGMPGISEWLFEQAEEEKTHMLKFIQYVNERGGKTVIPAIEQAPSNWKDVFVMFNEVLAHEKYISESINEVLAMAIKENDFATQNWIQWFVTEQVEEESSVQLVIDKLNMVGKSNLYLFDRDIMDLRATGE